MHKKVNEYNAMQLNEYNEILELVAGNEKDGKFYMKWSIASRYDEEAGGGVPVMKDDGKYMNIPVKVVLGNKEEALENLRWLISQVEDPPSSDVPF